MATYTPPDFVRHTYTLINPTKTYQVYQIADPFNYRILPELCRIEDYRGKSNARNIEKYFRIRTTTNWQTSEMVTGLRKHTTGIFHGNRLHNGKKHLIIFLLSDDLETLVVDYYRGFYPNTPAILQDILNKKERI